MDTDNNYKSVSEIADKVISVDNSESSKAPTVISMTDGVLIPKKGSHLINSWRLT